MFYGGEILEGVYQIQKEIGKGGTGTVYLAWHLNLQKPVVVKKIHDHVVGKVDVRTEVDILKKLHHRYLPQVYDFIQVHQAVYTVMDYIQGRDLQYYVDQGQQFSEKQLLYWLEQLCDVLDYLHNNNPRILHSDIKPGNIMVTAEGDACLIDFNISLEGQQNVKLKGISQNYAAPEQSYYAMIVKGMVSDSLPVLDGRMDLYSLAATFYTLMTGALPSEYNLKNYPIRKIDVPFSDGFCAVIEKGLSTAPENRFQSAYTMKRAVEHLYREDANYKKIRAVNWVCSGISVVMLLVGVWGAVYGWQSMGKDSYEKDYGKFVSACDAYDNNKIIDNALYILNSELYEGILENNKADKGALFYSVGEAYFEQEYYRQASEYFQFASEELPEEGKYYCDWAISVAREGNLDKAERIMEDACGVGTDQERVSLVNLPSLGQNGKILCRNYRKGSPYG